VSLLASVRFTPVGQRRRIGAAKNALDPTVVFHTRLDPSAGPINTTFFHTLLPILCFPTLQISAASRAAAVTQNVSFRLFSHPASEINHPVFPPDGSRGSGTSYGLFLRWEVRGTYSSRTRGGSGLWRDTMTTGRVLTASPSQPDLTGLRVHRAGRGPPVRRRASSFLPFRGQAPGYQGLHAVSEQHGVQSALQKESLGAGSEL
jgi:hypothetical protein